MAQTEQEQHQAEGLDDRPKEKGGKVADYLAAPRKKRKSYVLMALGKGANLDLSAGMEHYLRTNFKGVAISAPRTPEELFKTFSRQIVLLIFDDEFMDLDQGLAMIAEMKRKKSAAPVPVLFLTRQPDRLIQSYNKNLAAFHEADDYINHARAEPAHVFSKIRLSLTNTSRRRSRRYKIDMPLNYYLLSDDKTHPAHLIDLSVHGGLLKADDGKIFRLGDQLKLNIPVTEILPKHEGDFLKISAKVQRVFIDGTQAGISFEHVSDKQLFTLTKFLTEYVNDQIARRALVQKTRAART
jgi:DNA-binding response OmpR family regulator